VQKLIEETSFLAAFEFTLPEFLEGSCALRDVDFCNRQI